MLRFFSPTLRIALGLTCVVISLGLTGSSLGLLPQPSHVDSASQERVVRVLAARLLPAVGDMNAARAAEVIKEARDINPEIASIGVRQINGEMFASTPSHGQYWLNLPKGAMPPTQLFADVLYGAKTWGRVEVRFREPPKQVSLVGLPSSLTLFFLYVGLASFGAFWFYLRRIVTELDPSQAVPERVQNAFDTMSEGVLVLDMGGSILLANSALCDKLGRTQEELFGQKASLLSWVVPEDGLGLPWQRCLETGEDVRSVPISLQMANGGRSNFVVNVTSIKDQGAHRGVIATFDDITELHETNQRLNLANVELKKTQDEIRVQNEQLRHLASYDPLSGCLNRRAFFADFDTTIRSKFDAGEEIACIMVDIDHFKRINDTFGHSTGDKVIAGMANTLKTVLRDFDLIGRFGGEEFCVVMPSTAVEDAEDLANQVREALTARSHEWFDVPYSVTASIGLAMMTPDHFEPMDVINRADEALYVAKTSGRNRVMRWQVKAAEPGSSDTAAQHADTQAATAEPSAGGSGDAEFQAGVSDGGPDVSGIEAVPPGFEVTLDGDELTIVIDECVAALKLVAELDGEPEQDSEIDGNGEDVGPFPAANA